MFDFNPSNTDAYASYCLAAVSFLTLAHTVKRGEHIRVTPILQHVGVKENRALEIVCHVAAVFLPTALAWFSIRLVWQSYTFHNFLQSTDATPLRIPQLSTAIGATLLAIAFIGELVALIVGYSTRQGQPTAEPARMK